MRSIRPILVVALLFACAAAAFAKPAPPTTREQVAKLCAVLRSDAPQKEKADACRELARLGNKDAVAPLAALLADEKLSHMARYGLETIPGSAVDKALREVAGKLHGRALVGVIGSIGVRRDAKAVKLLADLLYTAPENDQVAQAAARALGSIGSQAAATALLDALPGMSAANQLAFCEGLLRCAETAAARGDRKEAMDIYDRLRQVPAPHQVRTAALRGAILTRQKDGLPLLALALHSDDYALVSATARTAQEMPCTPVTRLLAGELPNLPGDRQDLLIQTLAKRGDEAALPALFVAARKGEQPVRLAAIRALAQLGSPSALPVLLDLLGDTDEKMAQAAQESLAGLPGKEVDAAIMTMLSNGAPARRITAMELIVRRRMTSAIPALFEAAGGSDSNIRIAAVKRLSELAGPAELPRLLDLLAKAARPEDLEATEQALGAVSLRATNPDACVNQVEARLVESQPAQKCALLRVLGAAGGTNALRAVRAAVNDPNAEVRAAAIRTLSGWSTADAAPDLLELAKTASNPADKMICLRGYLAFAGQADTPKPQRLAMCRQAAPLVQNDDENKLLLAALGGIASAPALDLIQPYLDDPATKEEASTGIVNISDKLLQDAGSAKVAPRLIGLLDKVTQVTANADLAKHARELSAQAKSKADSK